MIKEILRSKVCLSLFSEMHLKLHIFLILDRMFYYE
jgi:hypothetical protein